MQVSRFSDSKGGEPLLDADDFADELKVTTRALYNLRHRGLLPPAIKWGNTLRWRRADIDRWLADHLDDGTGR